MNQSLRTGLALLEQGDYQGVHAMAIDLIHQNTDDPAPYFLLARVAQDHRNLAKADELFQRAAQLQPDSAMFAASYGQFLVNIGRQQSALTWADKAAGLSIDDAFVADMVGVIYSRTGFHEKAVPFFEQAVQLNPKPANFHYNLGASLQFSGNFAAAEDAYRRTIEREPNAYRAYSSLVGLSRQSPDANLLDTLKVLFAEHADDADARLHLGHAIAKTLEDLGEHPHSLDWLIQAKTLKQRSLNYDIQDDLQLFTAARNATSADFLHNASHSSDAPIFIIGLPRTGTTLVDRIVSSHPDVVSAGELNNFAGLIKALADSPSNRVLDGDTLARVTGADLAQLGHDYVRSTRELARGAPRFTDKMPLNFFYAGLIHKALPNARIVALRRDPMDSCLSNFRQLFSTAYSYYNYSFDLHHTATYYQAYDELVAYWRNTLPANRFLELHYETLVLEQEPQTRRLLEFCALPWDEACMRFHENVAPVSTASSVQVRKPLYTGSIGRWKKYGDRLDALKERLTTNH